ncbi:MAG: type III-A CRISPR-associated RAMP protein Csm3 [Candidatus Riflebacteria bacterium]|nr:type III-A CRISPR-associated RAMP protein Csm3 [Candidatus Riflebacteria bacterium]
MKLSGIIQLDGTITLRSGLHIGSGNMEMHIGGTDNPVIKHPYTLEPYIPGSSLKGKIRSLMELASGLVPETRGEPVGLKTLKVVQGNPALVRKAEIILQIFGHAPTGSDSEKDVLERLGPTRVAFADCPLDEGWLKKAKENHWPLTEEKSENSINRIQGTAQNPRYTERVPAGAEFRFRLSFKVLKDGDRELFEELLKGLKLLEGDALGGSGSRGYGRIEFTRLHQDGQDITARFRQDIKAV